MPLACLEAATHSRVPAMARAFILLPPTLQSILQRYGMGITLTVSCSGSN